MGSGPILQNRAWHTATTSALQVTENECPSPATDLQSLERLVASGQRQLAKNAELLIGQMVILHGTCKLLNTYFDANSEAFYRSSSFTTVLSPTAYRIRNVCRKKLRQTPSSTSWRK